MESFCVVSRPFSSGWLRWAGLAGCGWAGYVKLWHCSCPPSDGGGGVGGRGDHQGSDANLLKYELSDSQTDGLTYGRSDGGEIPRAKEMVRPRLRGYEKGIYARLHKYKPHLQMIKPHPIPFREVRGEILSRCQILLEILGDVWEVFFGGVAAPGPCWCPSIKKITRRESQNSFDLT